MTSNIISQKELKELLDYNPDTGVFIRRKDKGKTRAGDIVGTMNGTGYLQFGFNYKIYRLHRLAFLYMTGFLPKNDVDHINHDKTDNRWENLRVVTKQENLKNSSKSINNTSGVTGVYWGKAARKWLVHISIDGKDKHLGYFESKFDACCVRKSAEIRHGYHKNHGI